jgi:hypothetical protein
MLNPCRPLCDADIVAFVCGVLSLIILGLCIITCICTGRAAPIVISPLYRVTEKPALLLECFHSFDANNSTIPRTQDCCKGLLLHTVSFKQEFIDNGMEMGYSDVGNKKR